MLNHERCPECHSWSTESCDSVPVLQKNRIKTTYSLNVWAHLTLDLIQQEGVLWLAVNAVNVFRFLTNQQPGHQPLTNHSSAHKPPITGQSHRCPPANQIHLPAALSNQSPACCRLCCSSPRVRSVNWSTTTNCSSVYWHTDHIFAWSEIVSNHNKPIINNCWDKGQSET